MSQVKIPRLVDEIRNIYESGPVLAETLIEKKLEEDLSSFSSDEKLVFLENLAAEFDKINTQVDILDNKEMDKGDISELFSILLKGKVSPEELSSKEFLEKLAQSLNTLFEELNRLVNHINSMLLGRDAGDKTLRGIMVAQLKGDTRTLSPEEYVGQIGNAFKIAHDAFKNSMRSEVEKIMKELDPAEIEAESGGSKFDPRRKAKYFAIYEEKYDRLKKWFESERFMNDFLRRFEDNCYKLSMK